MSDTWTAEQWAVFQRTLNADLPKTLEEWLRYLSRLSRIDYDQQRKAVAKRLDLRVTTLDFEVDKLRPKTMAEKTPVAILTRGSEPWLSPVNGATLLNAIQELIERYAILPAGASVALALWILHTYLLDAAEASPILAITSPEKRCGKTVVLELMQALTFKPLPAANITAPALFRTVESLRPTLPIDEADSFLRDNEELRGVLNSGHRRKFAFVLRCDGDAHEPRQFSTWCAKAIALIGKLPSTLEDRSIVISMRRKSREERVKRIVASVLTSETDVLCRMAARWARDNTESLRFADPLIPYLHDRAADCWRPLLAIAEQAGGKWRDFATSAAQRLTRDEDGSLSVQLLSDIRGFSVTAHRILPFADNALDIGAGQGFTEIRGND
jgi:putative DNA primase/helicase